MFASGTLTGPARVRTTRLATVTFAAEHLADFKVPQYLVVRPEPLPKNPAGKVLKALLREQIQWGRPLR